MPDQSGSKLLDLLGFLWIEVYCDLNVLFKRSKGNWNVERIVQSGERVGLRSIFAQTVEQFGLSSRPV